MGFEDFIETENKHHHHNRLDSRHGNQRYSYGPGQPYGRKSSHSQWMSILQKLWNNPGLRRYLVIAVAVILILAVGLIILLMPFILKLINTISQVGLDGLPDLLTDFINKVLKVSILKGTSAI